jgi:hypothetical protein
MCIDFFTNNSRNRTNSAGWARSEIKHSLSVTLFTYVDSYNSREKVLGSEQTRQVAEGPIEPFGQGLIIIKDTQQFFLTPKQYF